MYTQLCAGMLLNVLVHSTKLCDSYTGNYNDMYSTYETSFLMLPSLTHC